MDQVILSNKQMVIICIVRFLLTQVRQVAKLSMLKK